MQASVSGDAAHKGIASDCRATATTARRESAPLPAEAETPADQIAANPAPDDPALCMVDVSMRAPMEFDRTCQSAGLKHVISRPGSTYEGALLSHQRLHAMKGVANGGGLCSSAA